MKPTVILFVAKGCHACAAAEPVFREYLSAHPLQFGLILDSNGPYPAHLGVKIRATPTYLISAQGKKLATAEGAMSMKQLDKWVRAAETVIEAQG